MSKMTLGNDFSDDSNPSATDPEETDEKTLEDDETTSDENDDSTNPVNGKNNQEDGDELIETPKTEIPPKKEEKKVDPESVLKGLLETEKKLDGDNSSIEEKIAAAKTRITQKRQERRDKRDLVDSIDSKFPEITHEENDDLSDVDKDTLVLLERFVKAKGLVPKSELSQMTYQQAHKMAERDFYKNHPEYSAEHDTDDVLYKAIKKELSYFATPKDAELIPALFEKAHREVIKQYPDRFKVSKKTLSDEDIAKSARLKTSSTGGNASSGGSSPKPNSSNTKTYSPAQISALQNGGWSDEEVKALINK